ncbi:MAG: DUF4139 domain-containing protein [Planctomycetota bacterium]|jgi:hypothetical protein
MDSNFFECESRITKVDVYARGAVVTRSIELPIGLQAEACTLVLSDVSMQLENGSLRTTVDGERQIASLRTRISKPDDTPQASSDAPELRALYTERNTNQKQIERVRNQIDLFEGLSLNTDMMARSKNSPPPNVAERFSTALQVSVTVDTRLRALYTEMRARRATEHDINKRIRKFANAQPKPVHTKPVRQILIGLAEGGEHLRQLEVSYNVRSARWWPAYAVRLTEGGQRAAFALESFVAQQSGEDWTDVDISLCTADMIQNVSLPVLDSMRLGRKQAPARSGYREPPEGLDALFKGIDTYLNVIPTKAVDQLVSSRDFGIEVADEVVVAKGVFGGADEGAPEESWEEERYDEDDDIDSVADASEMMAGSAAPEMDMPPPMPASAPAPVAKAGAGRRKESPKMSKKRSMASGPGRGGGAADMALDDLAMELSEPPSQEPESSTSDEWLDFDQLRLGGARDGGNRGRLHQFGRGSTGGGISGLRTPDNSRDPIQTRGMFDHRYKADGQVDIPSNGHAHRISLKTKDAASEMNFRCAPRVDDRVFREVALTNPFEAPLLPGPIDVFIDGTLAMSSSIEAVDRGGKVNFGIGEEQRLRVARNVKVHEESKGLLGGKSEIDHVVNIDIASSLGVDVVVDVIGRIPVSDDEKIDVSLLRSKPDAEKYDQRDRDNVVDGGLRWRLPVPAGGKSGIEYEYRIVLPADYELNGGNRRE